MYFYRFPPILDQTERTQRHPRSVEGVDQTGPRADRSWAAVEAAVNAHGFCVYLSLSLFLLGSRDSHAIHFFAQYIAVTG